MDPLEKRYNESLDNPQQHRDAGEISDAPQGDLKPWHDPGLAEDVSRSIEKVQQQEHWLQGQDSPNLLEQTNPAAPQPTAGGIQHGRDERKLWVVDTTASNWEARIKGLGSSDELLLLEAGDHGLERVGQSLQGKTYTQINLIPGEAAKEPGAIGLGSDQLTSGTVSEEQQQQLSTWSQALSGECAINVIADGIHPNLRAALSKASGLEVTVEAESTTPLETIRTTLQGDANDLLSRGRELLSGRQATGELLNAVERSFSSLNQGLVLTAVAGLLNQSQSPEIQWARFENSGVRGAFLKTKNTILISEDLRHEAELLDAVLLEELGHWLESTAETDSKGDEGERFAAALLGRNLRQERGVDKAQLAINGELVEAELSNHDETEVPGETGGHWDETADPANLTQSTIDPSGTLITIPVTTEINWGAAAGVEIFFTVRVNGNTIPNSAIAEVFDSGLGTSATHSPIQLRLEETYAVGAGDTVEVRYEPPLDNSNAGRLEDLAGADLAGFTVYPENASSGAAGPAAITSTNIVHRASDSSIVITAPDGRFAAIEGEDYLVDLRSRFTIRDSANIEITEAIQAAYINELGQCILRLNPQALENIAEGSQISLSYESSLGTNGFGYGLLEDSASFYDYAGFSSLGFEYSSAETFPSFGFSISFDEPDNSSAAGGEQAQPLSRSNDQATSPYRPART